MIMNNKLLPWQKWRLDEIQDMLNHIEGYENVVIEFQYKLSDNWNNYQYECKCGIRERNVEGWLLKYEFIIDAKNESELKYKTWGEMTNRLVTDVWRTSINSFRNEQQCLNSFKQRTEFKNPPLTEEQTSNFITNIENMTNEKTNMTNNNIQTKWTDNETTRWIMSTTIVSLFLYAMYALYKYELLFPTILTLFSMWLIAGAIIGVKETINKLLDE